MWYPGVAGGVATADVLTGAVNPGGKLPITFPDGSAARPRFPTDDPGCNPAAIVIPNNNTGTGANDGNCPLYPGVFLTDPTQGQHTYRTVDMSANGIFQGYKWYDLHNVAPLYPYGHGLSYTKFDYSKLHIDPSSDGGIDVSFRVRNTGKTDGTEVPQVYVGPSASNPDGVELARKSLGAFERIELARGDAADVKLHVAPRELSYWSTSKHAWVLATGERVAYVGSSSRDIRLQASVDVTGPSLGVKTIGSEVDANRAGMAEAFRAVAPADGTIHGLNVFVAKKTKAKTLVAGVYADAGGHPGALLASGSLASPASGAWNAVPIPATAITEGQSYWIALLGVGGDLNLQDECCGGDGSQPSETSRSTSLSSLPAAWTTGTVYPQDGPVSAYALLEGAG